MSDKLKKQGRQMATGKSDRCIVPVKPGNAGGGKAATLTPRSEEASTVRRDGDGVLTK